MVSGGFSKLGVLLVGVLVMITIAFAVYIRVAINRGPKIDPNIL